MSNNDNRPLSVRLAAAVDAWKADPIRSTGRRIARIEVSAQCMAKLLDEFKERQRVGLWVLTNHASGLALDMCFRGIPLKVGLLDLTGKVFAVRFTVEHYEFPEV